MLEAFRIMDEATTSFVPHTILYIDDMLQL